MNQLFSANSTFNNTSAGKNNSLGTQLFDAYDKIIKPFEEFLDPYKVGSFEMDRGTPQLHEELDCQKHQNDQQCSHKVFASSPMVGAGHHVRAKIQHPIIGILTQPIPKDSQWEAEFERVVKEVREVQKKKNQELFREDKATFPQKQFIESSHVKFLEAAGARVIPIDFTMEKHHLEKILSQINGIYIPGDSPDLVSGSQYDYTRFVSRILKIAQKLNEEEHNHFPVFGVSYGFLSIIKSQMIEENQFQKMDIRDTPSWKRQINLIHDPKHTYLFDEYTKENLDKMLDQVSFFPQIELGITVNDFVIEERGVSQLFVPVASFDDDRKKNRNEEIVAMIEGIIYPWFGIGYRIDQIQFAFGDDSHLFIDHSRSAILHAQKIANFFVDECRLSANEFEFIDKELEEVDKIKFADVHEVQIPTMVNTPSMNWREESMLYPTELYLF